MIHHDKRSVIIKREPRTLDNNWKDDALVVLALIAGTVLGFMTGVTI